MIQLYSLWSRDMKHIVRQPGRVLSYIGQPLIVWIFLGAGFAGSFAASNGLPYSDYLFPGIVTLVSLFSALFSTMSIIEDRQSGFLQGVLASPVPRYIIALSKSLVGTSLGLFQASIFMLFLPLTGIPASFTSALLALAVIVVIGMALTTVGFMIAWKVKSNQGFHALMNILLLPLWMLSGAFFPIDGASVWMQWVVKLNPLYYMTSLFSSALYLPAPSMLTSGPGFATAALITFLTLTALTTYSFKVAKS
jgi:ABC-2 type transport system permease protein